MPTTLKRGEVDLPGFGILRFDLAALEALQQHLGDNWLPTLHDKLGALDLPTIKFCIDVATAGSREGELDFAPLSEPGGVSRAVDAIHDAISYAIFDKSHAELLEEAQKEEEERIAKKIERMESNPLLAAAFLRDLGLLGTPPDSAPTKSEDSPQ